MSRRDGGCPLCGARLKPEQVLDACDEILDGGKGLLGCRCPYCQGYFEVLPRDGALDIGYLRFGRFEAVCAIACPGLQALADDAGVTIELPPRRWRLGPAIA